MAGAETQTGSGLSLSGVSESGFHCCGLLALSRVILRLRVNIGSGSDTQTHYQQSVLGLGRLTCYSRHLARHRAAENIGLKFRLRCASVSDVFTLTPDTGLGLDLHPLLVISLECTLREWE